MIENANDDAVVQIEYDDVLMPIHQSANISDIIGDLQKRRDTVISGGINCIPLPVPRFRSQIPGIEQEQYVIVTAPTKCGKSQLSSYVYLYNALDYAFEHKDQCSVHIIYFSLEESYQRVLHRYMSHLLYKLDEIRISPQELRSTSNDCPVSQEILDKFSLDQRYIDRLAFFEECVQFETEETNPTGILRVCEEYAKKVGEYKTTKGYSRGNEFKEVDIFRSYKQHDPNHYKICFIDHSGLVDQERGMSLKQSMDKLSEYCVKYLRNRYKYTVVWIQQQAMEAEGLEAIKQKRMLPAVATLGDTKYTARDCNIVLGLFDPSQFGLKNWLGYKIDDNGEGLKSHARFLYFLRGRDGEAGGVCPLFFDGATCTFEELPLPTDSLSLVNYYKRVKEMKTYKQSAKLSAIVGAIIKQFFYGKKDKESD